MNIPIPANLCNHLHLAKVGDIVDLRIHLHSSILRLVTKVTPTTVSIQNGGVGTLLTFRKADGVEKGGGHFRPTLHPLTENGYRYIVQRNLKEAAVDAILSTKFEARALEEVLEAAKALVIFPENLKLPTLF